MPFSIHLGLLRAWGNLLDAGLRRKAALRRGPCQAQIPHVTVSQHSYSHTTTWPSICIDSYFIGLALFSCGPFFCLVTVVARHGGAHCICWHCPGNKLSLLLSGHPNCYARLFGVPAILVCHHRAPKRRRRQIPHRWHCYRTCWAGGYN